jgi:hypothetical protein
MIIKSLAAVGLGGLVVLGFMTPQAGAVGAAGKPMGGCALLGTANAARILGGPAAIVTEKTVKTPLGLVRSCRYSGAGIDIAYDVTTFSSAAFAKGYLSEIYAQVTDPTTDAGALLMGVGQPKIHGYPSVVDYFQLIAQEGEAPPPFDILSQVAVRKGATVLQAQTFTDDDSTPMLRAVANIVVPRM